METEYEAKFYPVNKKNIRNKLEEIGAKLETPERTMNRTNFGKEDNEEMTVDYVRVRDEGNLVRLSAKVHAVEGGSLDDQKETDLIVESYDDCISVLKLAGLKVSKVQETKRETWEYEGAHIEIDTWPGLETYIEIEARSEEQVKEIAELLGKEWGQRRITSVVEVYAEVYKVTNEEVMNIVEISFANPPQFN